MTNKTIRYITLPEIVKDMVESQLVLEVYQVLIDDVDSIYISDYIEFIKNKSDKLELIEKAPLNLDLETGCITIKETKEVKATKLSKYLVIIHNVQTNKYYITKGRDMVVMLDEGSCLVID